MRIAQLATNVERVPPAGYGGTELVVSMLTEGLVRRGHEVTLFATGDSQTSARLVSVTNMPMRPHVLTRNWQAYDIQTLIKMQDMKSEFDVIHNHMGYQALPWLDHMDLPNVTTNHNPIKQYSKPIYLAYKHLPFAAISHSYKNLNMGDVLNYVDVVYNGIVTEDFIPTAEPKRDYLLFIGRVCRDKGTADAIEIAERLNLPLVIAGKVDEADASYFEEYVRPHMNTDQVKFLGEVTVHQKVELYNGAIAVVYPVAFEEPFGLVMAESLASGAPVMAFDRGSVRELLTDGETAIIGKTTDDLVNRFGEIEKMSRSGCRKRVQEMFGVSRMIEHYEDVYERLIAEKRRK